MNFGLPNIIIGGVGIVGIDLPNCMFMLFKLRPGVLSKTLLHMWGTLSLPMFLFNVGLLTLMNIDSLIFLAKLLEVIQGTVFQFSLRVDEVHSSG